MASSRKIPPWTGYGLSTLGLEAVSLMSTSITLSQHNLLGVDVQNTSSAAEPLIPTSKVDSPNPILAQHRSAHDAWFDGNIKIRLFQDADGMLRKNTGQCNELGMPRSIQSPVRLVHSLADDFAIFDEDAADGRLVTD